MSLCIFVHTTSRGFSFHAAVLCRVESRGGVKSVLQQKDP